MASAIPSSLDSDLSDRRDQNANGTLDGAGAGSGAASAPPERTARPSPSGRRGQWGADRRRRALPVVPQPVGERRIALARLAIIVTVTAWLGYVITWFFQDFFHPGDETAVDRAEAVVYLLIVTLLSASALAYLLSRVGYFYRIRTHHRASRAILDHFYRRDDTDADHDHPVLPGGRPRHPQHLALRGLAGIPG